MSQVSVKTRLPRTPYRRQQVAYRLLPAGNDNRFACAIAAWALVDAESDAHGPP